MPDVIITCSIDGALSLSPQESAIKFQEAKGYELLTLAPDTAGVANVATFKRLALGKLPAELHLTDQAVPAGKTPFWVGFMYVESQIKSVFAFR